MTPKVSKAMLSTPKTPCTLVASLLRRAAPAMPEIPGPPVRLTQLTALDVLDALDLLAFGDHSFELRHEYFRRILCNLLGAEMASGLLPKDFDLVGALVEDVCFRNAESYFGFELSDRDREAASAPAPVLRAALG